jgi:hypothetical protein
MQRRKVQSSNIESVGYDEETRTLEIEFHGGGTYRYFDVPGQTHNDLMAADSIGRYFREHINGHFRFVKEGAQSDGN